VPNRTRCGPVLSARRIHVHQRWLPIVSRPTRGVSTRRDHDGTGPGARSRHGPRSNRVYPVRSLSGFSMILVVHQHCSFRVAPVKRWWHWCRHRCAQGGLLAVLAFAFMCIPHHAVCAHDHDHDDDGDAVPTAHICCTVGVVADLPTETPVLLAPAWFQASEHCVADDRRPDTVACAPEPPPNIDA